MTITIHAGKASTAGGTEGSHGSRTSDLVHAIFATFDAKDVPALGAFMTDDVSLRLGNAPMVEGKSAFIEAVSAFLDSVAGFRHEVISVWSDRSAVIVELNVHYARLDGREVTVPWLQRL